jgi:hypothetical protein
MQQGWLRSGIIVLFLGVIFCYWLPVAASTSTCPEGGKCIFNDTGPILIKSQKGDIKLQATSTLNNIYLNYVDTASYGLGVSAGGALYHNGNVIVVADGEFYGISISGLSGGLLGQIGTYAPEDLLKLKNSQQVFTFSTSTAYWGVNDITHSVNGLSNIYSWLTTNLVGQLAFVRDSDSTSSRQYLQYRFNNVNSPNDWDEWTEVCDISNNCRNFFNVSLDNNSNNSLVMYQDPDILIDSGLKVIDPSLLSDCSNLYTSSGVIGCGSGGGGGGGGLSGLGTANYLSKWSDTSTLADSILYEDSNKIGLGTTSPYTQLHIYNNSEGPIISLSGLDIKYRGLTIKDTNNSEKWFVGNNDSNNFVIRATGSNDILTVGASSGNVGIGTASPEEQLTITKNFRLSPTTHENLNGIIYKDGNRFIHDFNYGYSGSTTTVGQNTFIGINAGNLTMGEGVISPFQASYNVGVGASAFTSNTSGNYNTAVGASSLYSNTSGANNTAFGYSALTSNMSGNYNTAVGASSLYSNTSGYNTAVGYASLYSNISGNYNTAVGASSLYSNTSSANNTAVGYYALYFNTSGISNTALGSYALYNNTSGNSNTALGYHAFYNNKTGSTNVAVGINAGMLDASSQPLIGSTNSIFLGGSTKAQSNDQTNQIVIGVNAIGAGSNSVVLGNTSITKTLLRGDIGIGTSSPATKLHIYDASSGPIITLSGLDTNYRGLVIKDTSDAEKWFIGSNTSTNTNFVIRATSSNDILTISSSNGNVGIGTTPDATYKLSINGTIKTNLTSATPGSYCLYVNQDGVIGAKTSDCGTATGGGDNLGDHTATQNIKLNGYWLSGDGGSEGVYVDTGGNVGIGASSSLGSRMVIKGSGSDSLASALNVQNSSGNSLLYVRNDGRVGIGSTSPSVSLVVNGNVIAGTPTADGHLATKAYVDSSVKLWVNNGTSLYASSTGWSVGIGTTSPDTKLHIYDATSGPIISLSGSDSNYRGLAIKNTSNNEKWFIGNNTSSNSFVIRANNSNDVLTVSSSAGNVGIGSSSPGYTLSVSGTGYFSNTVTAAPPTATGNVATKGYVDNLISELSVGPTIFVGLSTTVMSPNQSGYSGVNNNICQAVSSTSHLCTVEDILEIVNNGQAITIPTTSVGYWISNGPPGYTANANDCAGFTTSSPNFLGAVWMRNDSYPNGVGALRYCNATGYFACCK